MYHFIISGKDSPRRDHMKCEFSKIGIEPHFFDAIMGRDLSEEELHQIAKPNTFLGVGEIGCAASHLGVYREFLQSEEPSVFIFEDDGLIPEKEYLPVFQDAKAWMDSLERPSLLVFQKSRYHKTFVKHLSMGVDIHSARNLFFTFGYLLNRKAAQNILRAQTPIRFEIDAFKFYYWLDFCDLYCLNQNVIAPAPISHDSVIEAGGGEPHG